MIQINTEDPKEHWQFASVKERIVLDLGCGRWELVDHPLWPTTPEYFIQKGAKKVIGVDCDANEIIWFNSNLNESMYDFANQCIKSTDCISFLIGKHSPNCMKIDIEGAEIHLINLSDDIFKLVDEYYIEVHSDHLYNQCILKLAQNRYDIYQQIHLIHTGACKVIFAKKIQ